MLVQLVGEVGKGGWSSFSVSPQDVIESLGRPNHFPEKDLFVAEKGGNIIGYVDVTEELNIGRIVLSCVAHPECGGNGVATKLIERAIDRGRELMVKRIHVNTPEESTKARELFVKMGFRFIRRFLELRLDLTEVHVPDMGRLGPRYRHMKSGEEEKLVQIQNRSFADTWGFNPNTVDEIVYRIGLPNCSPEDIILACDGGNVIGYCWTRIYPGETTVTKAGKGRIHMLGVDPDHRSRGVGKAVLLAGLYYLKNKGLGMVDLTVDSKNKAARALYRSAGFQIRTRSLWYEKGLD
ncbi:MAG: GNAT family N-acetyltransferase [Candidatus Aenigmarchaeota archaeon]|nr:GNAT family N-acetyltransferase [Candidatus Aenigmarchaeota archaeon]